MGSAGHLGVLATGLPELLVIDLVRIDHEPRNLLLLLAESPLFHALRSSGRTPS